MTPDRPTDRQTDISIYRAPMELKIKKKMGEKIKVKEEYFFQPLF